MGVPLTSTVFNIINILLASTTIAAADESPCPDVFTYMTVDNDIKGFIDVPSPRNVHRLNLDVKLSVGNRVGDFNGNLVLYKSKDDAAKDFYNGRNVQYLVNFPIWRNRPPKVVRIAVNDMDVCTGSPFNVQQVSVLTTVNLEHTLAINNLANSNVLPQSDTKPDQNSQNHFGPGNPFFHSNHFDSSSKEENVPDRFKDNPFFNFEPSSEEHEHKKVYQNNPFFNDNVRPRPELTTVANRLPPIQSNFNFNNNNNNVNMDNVENICGVTDNVVHLIPYGRNTTSKYPWLVAIFVTAASQGSRVTFGPQFQCGGNLVTDRHVISAAHCFPSDKSERDYQFVMNDNPTEELFSFINKTIRAAQRIIIHSEYLAQKADADIAVIVLQSPVRFNSLMRPVCLWNGDTNINRLHGTMGRLVGWGSNENNRLAYSGPKEVDLPIVSNDECRASHRKFTNTLSERAFCAGARQGDRWYGACGGDSGSGLLIRRNGRWILRGVVSLTILENSDCRLITYTAFTDVAQFLTWIRGIVFA